ncbi:MAG: hypothetical protein PHU06_01945 [Gallionella sp.]|nr:hypothetical protein [Gallionella sp.]MDD4958849.1 hypothetical protein [Gallionella sp.]
MDRLFIFIKKINSILWFLLLIGIASGLLWGVWESFHWQRRDSFPVVAESGEKKTVMMNFGSIERVVGTETQMVDLALQGEEGRFYSGSGYRKNENVINLLFVTGQNQTAHWLFKNHKNLILTAVQLHEKGNNDSDQTPTRALYLEYVTQDTDGDGHLSDKDSLNIALTKTDGSGFLDVLRGVDRVLFHELLTPESLSILYQKNKTLRQATVSLPNMTLQNDREVVALPNKF